jgi:putative mRNA 3-end processing factor
MALIEFTKGGMFCREAGVYIDPVRPVPRAVITHGHSDHARQGSDQYLCSKSSVNILKHRLGKSIAIQGLSYGETISLNGVQLSFHPAGHILGSSQVRLEHKGEVWVITGDYKVRNDNISGPFELVKCHTLITECTFGLPVFNWENPCKVIEDIVSWWSSNQEKGLNSILSAYSLGKAQRLINHLGKYVSPIYTHSAIENMCDVYRKEGVLERHTIPLQGDMRPPDPGALIIAPPSAIDSSWSRKFGPSSLGIASGWMAIRGNRRRRNADRGFCLSDHCDWSGLNQVVEESGAEMVYTMHGYANSFSRWLQETGIDSSPVHTEMNRDQEF